MKPGQTWINPSPRCARLTEATLYPGIGLLETTNVSVGRGTDTPFEVVGAPLDRWSNPGRLSQWKTAERRPICTHSIQAERLVNKDQDLGGINIVVTGRDAFDSVRTGLEIAAALEKLYPKAWDADKFGRLLVNQETLEMVKSGDLPEAIEKAIAPKLAEYEKRRATFLALQMNSVGL